MNVHKEGHQEEYKVGGAPDVHQKPLFLLGGGQCSLRLHRTVDSDTFNPLPFISHCH